jgi:hypothetical protein
VIQALAKGKEERAGDQIGGTILEGREGGGGQETLEGVKMSSSEGQTDEEIVSTNPTICRNDGWKNLGRRWE